MKIADSRIFLNGEINRDTANDIVGQLGRRFILPNSKTMIHESLLSGGVGGMAISIRNMSDSILETRNIGNGILAKHTGKTIKEVNKATSFDNYMNAEKSVEFAIKL